MHSNYTVAATCFKVHSRVTALIAIIAGHGAFPRSFRKAAKIQCQAAGGAGREEWREPETRDWLARARASPLAARTFPAI